MTTLPVKYLRETAAWVQDALEVRVPDNVSTDQLLEILAERLESLISKDFQQFVYLLYRIDVSEKRVKQLLNEAALLGTDPYKPIASLIVERQLQKIISRASFRQEDLPDDEERW
ncbi:hypothetical protein SAMN05660909_04279 [Chitinophaga terrae (ex Kim and Jung 2007)]|uniref:Uncharacterized protein n=1 Tax=Chitinophaga terrae (ex Kim and Jung 2007) TaxID=408074 RepID=A0A1H4FBK9_9BACT|nr:hypothetical protein [Chitinophaga terrae (ex Kim and Jung 2007)]GEP92268.1 hypothetical protein CTE07_39130 [Chitinophaga terrae (ex Kim and Jung 2007)]SEA94250.1 hypothetical protein SAMN05660909_04279 [Chitinophaga terrae (ex Kim and Jung 2007)]